MAATAVLTLCLPAAAEELRVRPKAVVELFTSQGCAQCPPADALLTALAEEDDVVALAYHVDYWDYVGWTDTFGSPEFSDRQRGPKGKSRRLWLHHLYRQLRPAAGADLEGRAGR